MGRARESKPARSEYTGSPEAPLVTPLRGRWLVFARVGWVVLAALTLGLDAAGIPYAYAQYKSVCTSAACADDFDRLTPDRLQALQDFGLSADFFAVYSVALLVVATLVFAAVAAVIFWRRSYDRMALFGSFTLLIFGGAALTDTMRALADAHPAFWFPAYSLDYAGQVAFGVFFFVFPDGRFVPRWTRWLAVAYALLFVPDIFFPDSALNLLNGPLFLSYPVSLLVAQVYRYRRVSSPSQRQQTKWVVFGATVAVVGFVGVSALYNLVPTIQQFGLLGSMVANACVYGFLLLIPLSIGVAILRSRLYDIDVIINRTLVYGALTAALALVYVVSIVLIQGLFRTLTGEDSQIAVVASTLAIAALFGPFRRRIQAAIDRRFYRKKYDAAKTLEALSARLRDETDLDVLTNEVVAVVRETLQPEHVSIWLRPLEKNK
jgi:hypothetical protein